MLDILASGRVVKIVPSRSANGNEYVRLTIITGQGDNTALVNASAFDADIIAALKKVKIGDAISVSGNGSLSAYAKDGEPRASLSLFVNRLLTHKAGKEKARNPDNYDRGGTKPDPRNYGQPWGLND